MKGVRIGWRPHLGNERIDAETLALCEAGVKALAGIGAEVVDHGAPFTNTLPVWGPLTFSIWASRFGALEKRLGDRVSASLRTWMAEGSRYSAIDVQDAMARRKSVYRELAAWFEAIAQISHEPSRDTVCLYG